MTYSAAVSGQIPVDPSLPFVLSPPTPPTNCFWLPFCFLLYFQACLLYACSVIHMLSWMFILLVCTPSLLISSVLHPANELTLGRPVFPSDLHCFPRVLYLAATYLNSDPLSHPHIILLCLLKGLFNRVCCWAPQMLDADRLKQSVNLRSSLKLLQSDDTQILQASATVNANNMGQVSFCQKCSLHMKLCLLRWWNEPSKVYTVSAHDFYWKISLFDE